MSIEIETKQIIYRGEKRIDIINFKALTLEELPLKYVKGKKKEYAYLHYNDMAKSIRYYDPKTGADFDLFYQSSSKTEHQFKKDIETLRRCVKRLQDINASLKKENKGWAGKEKTYII